MVNRIIAIVLAVVAATSGGLGYWSYYQAHLPGTLFMSIWTNSAASQITIASVEVHVAGEGNLTGWRVVISESQTISFNPNGYESDMKSSGLPQGSYDVLRFNVTKIVIRNVTYLEPGKWFVPPLVGHMRTPTGTLVATIGAFRISAGSSAVAGISLNILYYELIIADNGYLKPGGFVDVTY